MSDTHASPETAGQNEHRQPSRRKLLIGLSLGSGALAAAAAGYPVAKAVLDPAFQKGGRGGWQRIGTLADFPTGKTVLVTFIRPGARSYGGDIKKDTAYVTRRPGDWLALHNVCMHLGCPVRHQEGSGLYFCPCHGGVYDAEGVNVAGPPRIPLQRLGVRVQGQEVQLQSAAMPLPTLTWPGGVVSDQARIDEANDTPPAVTEKHYGLFLGWIEDRTGLISRLNAVAGHRVPRRSRWAFVFGSATLFAFILQVVTGITLAMFFEPSSATAYQSLQRISTPGTAEAVVRGLHYFGASLMVVMMGIHLIRVYLTAAYKYPREMQWISGVVMLFLVLAMAFTGQTLRWDQTAVWSVVVGAEQASRFPWIGPILARFLMAGDTLNAATLSRLYALHTYWFPALLFGLIGLHVFLVLRNGISEPPVPGRRVEPRTYKQQYQARVRRDGVPFWPDAAWRDTVFGSALILLMVFLAWKFGAPALSKPPDPSLINADPKPDWYLIWYFSILALWPYGITNLMIILAPLLAIAGLILLPLVSNKGERAPSRRPWAIGIVIVAIGMIFSLTLLGYREPWLPRFAAPPLTAQQVNSTVPSVVRGAALFHDQSCILCHRIDGQGGIRGPNLSEVGERLTRDQLTWRIQNGAASMPPYAGVLTTDQLRDLVNFLETRH